MAGRALVLGGGGVTGIAWELGMLAGLADAGVDLTAADLFVGTSAGSVVASMIAGDRPLADWYETQLSDPASEIPAKLGAGLLARYAWAMLRSRTTEQFGMRMGSLALAAPTVTSAQRREVIAARLPFEGWPERPLKVTAVDAATGEFVVFDRDSGVPLIDAVAASCAVPGVWPPHEINERRFVDGGMRSAVNADVAEGSSQVVILAPIVRGGGPMIPATKQVSALQAQGCQVTLVSPDAAATRAIGTNVLDPGHRKPAALAGRAQAAVVAEQVAKIWG
ncbi:patatin [Rhizocola hellebori]|uniref:Patatin n=1 Tax=Rhizocola hellebori TaxID=1392758 RepID=A0A8J3QA57_9ACTN|nr:patatin-like phospholipase family protein [Rhizocola hellebori]GIH06736.1 patatin [Rhizocola hellebori]